MVNCKGKLLTITLIRLPVQSSPHLLLQLPSQLSAARCTGYFDYCGHNDYGEVTNKVLVGVPVGQRQGGRLEFAAPVFHSGLTNYQSEKIEMVKKKALAIILSRAYTNYEAALSSTFGCQERKTLSHLCPEVCQVPQTQVHVLFKPEPQVPYETP